MIRKKALKKIIATSLIFCLLLNVTGSYIIFRVQQAAIKAEMKTMLSLQINTEAETVLIFPLGDKKATNRLTWEGNDEVNVDGQMYDVIEKKIWNNKLVIRCISDKKETTLISKYERMTDENNSKNKSALLLKLVNVPYVPAKCIELFISSKPISSSCLRSEITCSEVRDVLTPPPQRPLANFNFS